MSRALEPCSRFRTRGMSPDIVTKKPRPHMCANCAWQFKRHSAAAQQPCAHLELWRSLSPSVTNVFCPECHDWFRLTPEREARVREWPEETVAHG